MNCKPGDLAVRIKAPEGAYIQIGSIVLCHDMRKDGFSMVGGTGVLRQYSVGWRVEFRGERVSNDGYHWFVPDCDLRPILQNDGEDETLSWAPVPQRVEVAQ